MLGRSCAVCSAETPEAQLEEGRVRSNVRAFRDETFAFWRCPHCRSLHARDEVDLAHYYARYPFHDLPFDWRLWVMYERQLHRLRREGLDKSHHIIDYGCGGGFWVRFLRKRGYAHAVGFDEYSREFGDRSVLERQYDCVFSQDVIEHVPSPGALLDQFERLARPGALIAIGTPDAAAIDLSRTKAFEHTLHAPYHRHILSGAALRDAGKARGWSLERHYRTMYTNTLVPFLNERFYLHYTFVADGTLDALIEPVPLLRLAGLIALAPLTFFWGLFGYFFPRGTDGMAIFRRPRPPS